MLQLLIISWEGSENCKLTTTFRVGWGHGKVDMGQYVGGGVKNGQKLATLFMDAPKQNFSLHVYQ